MLLRLVPPSPLPTILFTLSFPQSLPSSLPLPALWAAHLHLLAEAGITPPPALLALDKSVVWPVLLQSITFDIDALTLTCTFIDNSLSQWPLPPHCMSLLDSVVRDVLPTPPPLPPPVPVPKKRRSILTSLVQAFQSTPTPPPSPRIPVYVPPPPLPDRTLRRRARSTLVDAFRRFVIPLLAPSRPDPYAYAMWAARGLCARQLDLEDEDTGSEGEDDEDSVRTPEDEHAGRVRVRVAGEDEGVYEENDADAYIYKSPAQSLPSETRNPHIRLRVQAQDLVHSLLAHARKTHEQCVLDEAVLEVRSRRRAWSMGQGRAVAHVTGGNGGGFGGSTNGIGPGIGCAGLGYGIPVRRSPLVQCWGQELSHQYRPGREGARVKVGCYEVCDEGDDNEGGDKEFLTVPTAPYARRKPRPNLLWPIHEDDERCIPFSRMEIETYA